MRDVLGKGKSGDDVSKSRHSLFAGAFQKIKKLRESLHCLGAPAGRSHTIFFDDEDKEKMANFDVATHFQTAPELADRAFNRPRLETLQQQSVQGAATTV